jgi:hypothetical protein
MTGSRDAPSWVAGVYATGIFGVLAAGVALAVDGTSACLGVAAGAILATANLWVIGLVVRAMVGGTRAPVPWVIVVLGKFAALFGVLCLLVFGGFVDILPLAVGIGALPVGIVVAQLSAPAVPEDRS